MNDVYNNCHRGGFYFKASYKDILTRLEEEGKIIVNPPANQLWKSSGEAILKDSCIPQKLRRRYGEQ